MSIGNRFSRVKMVQKNAYCGFSKAVTAKYSIYIQGGEPKIALSLYNKQQSQVQFLVPHPVYIYIYE